MKKLYLMRHAKASWAEADQPDHERPLKKKGLRHAPQMAAYLADRFDKPDLVFCSDSLRTVETLAPLRESWKLTDKRVMVTPDLYLVSDKKLVSFLAAVPETAGVVMLIGHNPGLTDLVNRLTPKSEYLKKIPTAGFVTLDLKIKSWADVKANCAKLQSVLKPRELFG